MKIQYRKIRMSAANKTMLARINGIIQEYAKQGYKLTLRQLYYQLVSRNVIANQQKEYAKLSRLLGEGRMAGIVDWGAIVDRLRELEKPGSWASTWDILDTAVRAYRRDNMEGQGNAIEVWVEKDSLSDVLARVTTKYGVGLQVNRGYASITAMHEAYHRFKNAIEEDGAEKFHILYLGDHDPSGQDMIRDIEKRFFEFWWGDNVSNGEDEEDALFDLSFPENPDTWEHHPEYDQFRAIFEITPVALTPAQIKRYSPPPNPAKMTDPRSEKFVSEHGRTSYEVDALPPQVLNQILTASIEELVDLDLFNDSVNRQEDERKAARITVDGLKPNDQDGI